MPGPSRSTLVVFAAITVIVLVLGLRWLGAGDPPGSAGESVLRPGGGGEASGARSEPASTGTAGSAAGAGTDPARGGAGTPGAGTQGEAILERAPAALLVVHVAGAVRRPGVYRLREGDRVADAVARAGGAARGADNAALNLAARLIDGQQVLLPRRSRAAGQGAAAPGASPPQAGSSPRGPSGAAAGGGGGPVSLASATLEQLDTLDGVGPVTAQKILDWRAKSGGFASVDDLAQIPGIGPKRLESLRAQVVP